MIDIYGTLGPSCSDTDTLEKMFHAGMTGVRLNLSHVTIKEASPQIEALHEAAHRCGIKAKLLIDMQGPELRVGVLKSAVCLENGTEAILGEDGIPVPEIAFAYLNKGQEVLLDDGKLLLEVIGRHGRSASARVIRGGELKSRKSIALPGSSIYPPTMTEQDLSNIALAAQYGVTGVMQPFVRDRHDLAAVRGALNAAGCGDIALFAKIENMDGVSHLDELIPECDVVVIARGDLGNAMPLWELPGVQKKIAAKCRKAGRPFLTVTQMLASMEKNPVPTRAEVSDIYNAVLDGSSAVMVTGETAVGLYPAEVIKYLANTAKEAQKAL